MDVVINYWAVLACGVGSFIFGFLWYGPIFGKQYMRMLGVSQQEAEGMMKDPAKRSAMMRNYFFTFVLALVTAFVFDTLLTFTETYYGLSGIDCAIMVAFITWLGFIVPATTNLIFFDKKKWDWWFLVNGYYLLQLLLIGTILWMW